MSALFGNPVCDAEFIGDDALLHRCTDTLPHLGRGHSALYGRIPQIQTPVQTER